MAHGKRRQNKKGNSLLLAIVKAEIIAIAATLLLVLLVSFLLFKGILGLSVVGVFNTIIKVAGSVLCAIVMWLSVNDKKLIFSALGSVIYILLSFVIFSLLNGSFSFTAKLFSDACLAVGSGAATALVLSIIYKK